MKYQFEEYNDDPHILGIHLRQTFKEGYWTSGDDLEIAPGIVSLLFTIDGLVGVTLGRHSIFLEKALLFSWEEITPEILFALQMIYDPDGKLEALDPIKGVREVILLPNKPGTDDDEFMLGL